MCCIHTRLYVVWCKYDRKTLTSFLAASTFSSDFMQRSRSTGARSCRDCGVDRKSQPRFGELRSGDFTQMSISTMCDNQAVRKDAHPKPPKVPSMKVFKFSSHWKHAFAIGGLLRQSLAQRSRPSGLLLDLLHLVAFHPITVAWP